MQAIERWSALLVIALSVPSGARAQDKQTQPATPAPSATLTGATTQGTPAQASTTQTGATAQGATAQGQSANARQDIPRQLASSDPAAVRAAIEALEAEGGVAAQRALGARLRAGLPPALTLRAVEALAALKANSATPALSELMQHRRDEVRLRALQALAALAPRGEGLVGGVMIAALEDPALEVRSTAAQVLSAAGQRRAVPALLAAYDRGLVAAVPAIGKLAGPANVEPLLARVNDGVLDPLIPAFDALLLRADFPLQDKVGLIGKMSRIGSPSAQRYLVDVGERLKLSKQPRLEQALSNAVKQAAPGEAVGSVLASQHK